MKEEIFGPVLPIVPYKRIDDVINHINSKDKPLAIYYFGDTSNENCQLLREQTSSGGFVCNEVINQVGSHTLGFGGVGASGYGRYGGFEGFKAFSNRKAVLVK